MLPSDKFDGTFDICLFSLSSTLSNSLSLSITQTLPLPCLAAGMGEQPLYNVSAVIIPASGPSFGANRRIGFRFFALVTGNDTDPNYVQRSIGADGTDTQGMYFRINGALFLSRGANMIPMEEMEVCVIREERGAIREERGGFDTCLCSLQTFSVQL